MDTKKSNLKEQFVEMIQQWRKFDAFYDKLHDLGIDLLETPLFDIPAKMFDLFIESHFDEETVDVINWWLFEDGREMYDKDENPIPLDTIDDLWEFAKGGLK